MGSEPYAENQTFSTNKSIHVQNADASAFRKASESLCIFGAFEIQAVFLYNEYRAYLVFLSVMVSFRFYFNRFYPNMLYFFAFYSVGSI